MTEFFGIRPKTYAYLINGYNDCCYDKEKTVQIKNPKEQKYL